VSAILFNRTFLTRLAESENRHVVNARLETVCVAQMRAQRRHSRIIQVLNMPTGQANQVMVGWCGQQFVNGPGLAQIGLGDECQVFEPLKHTVNGGFRHRNALGFKILLDALGRLMPSEFTQGLDYRQTGHCNPFAQLPELFHYVLFGVHDINFLRVSDLASYGHHASAR
jgi:hypothetical protein